ncbi:DNA-dependent ATPase [Ceratobasidium sp. AG-Ba]|nr:DNA-dependent ATPase [Ceratobasidium sp. AG-Ba]
MSNRGRGRGGARSNNEQGISVQNINPYQRRIRTANEGEGEAEGAEDAEAAGPLAASPATPASGATSRRSSGKRGRKKNDDSDVDSDNLDATDGEEPSPAPTTSKGKGKGKSAEKDLAKAKAKAKAAHEAKRQKRDDDDDEGEDEYKAPSKGTPITPGALPPIGSFEKCAVCGKTFTVTRYTMAADPPPGFLCHTCAKAGGADPFKKTGAPRGRKPVAEKRKIVNFEQKDVFKSLATNCIEIIAKHIDNLEALGDIGQINMDRIAKILAKQRSLTESTAKLFYDVENTSLTLYDASRLEPSAFHTLIGLNPNLRSLILKFCRGVDCTVLPKFASHLPHLTHLEIFGAFLARAPSFVEFFNEIGGRLEHFLLSHSPRFDLDCCQAMVKNCANNLTELRLCYVGKLDDSWLPLLHTCTNLKRLELAFPGGDASLTDEPTIELLRTIGTNLEYLNLGGHHSLTDDVLLEGVMPHIAQLKALKMSNSPSLTDEGVSRFFTEYNTQAEFECIKMRQNSTLGSESLRALLGRPTACIMRELVINGWKDVDEESCRMIPKSCPELRKLDVGFVRVVDDYLMKDLLEGLTKVEEISCFGCNRVTESCPKKAGVNIYGVESQSRK